MIGIGIIGYGYWGRNLLRNFADAPNARIRAVVDLMPERLAPIRRRDPSILVTASYREVLADGKVDAIVIATPAASHFELAMQALAAGKHVLVEKPLACTVEQAARLVDEAERRRKVLMVDHTFVYTSAVRRMREIVQRGDLGDVYYYDSVRANLGLFQDDVNVVWDLAVHDLGIMDYVLDRTPTAVSATGMSHIPDGPENIAYLTLFFGGTLIAHVHVNWLTPVKIRRTLLGGSDKMIVYDDLEQGEKLRVYDRGITIEPLTPHAEQEVRVGYRTGDMWAPQLDTTEALSVEVAHFLNCVKRGHRPITDGRVGLRVIRTLEAVTSSIRQRGQLVELPPEREPLHV